MARDEQAAKPAERALRPLPTRLLAELVGTFVLVFTAAGADVVDALYPAGIGHVSRYIAPGIAITAMIWSLSGVSGAHINPAISLGFAFRRSFPLRLVPGYVVAQVAGSTLAAVLLRGMFGAAIRHAITQPVPPFSFAQAFEIEIVLTFLLTFTILATADQEAIVGKNIALAVGGIVALCGLAFSPVSGASMNPALSLGPMIAAGDFSHAGIYVIAPILGAGIAAALVWGILGPAGIDDRMAARGKDA